MVTISPRQQTVPLRQVGRGAKRRRGWIKQLTAHYYLLLFHPLPTAWYSPLSQGEKVGARHCRNTVITISPRQQIVPLRQGDEERSDGGGG